MTIGYISHKKFYIIRIDVIEDDKDTIDIDKVTNKNFSVHIAKKYKVLSIRYYGNMKNLEFSESINSECLRRSRNFNEIDKYRIGNIYSSNIYSSNIEEDEEYIYYMSSSDIDYYYFLSEEIALTSQLNDNELKIYLKNKSGVCTRYFPNGSVHTRFFHNNAIINGKYEIYNLDGEIESESNYLEGQLLELSKKYYSDGKIENERYYFNGKKHGPYRKYFPDGSIQEEANYNDGKIKGDFKVYNKMGKLVQIIHYHNGKMTDVNVDHGYLRKLSMGQD